MHPPRSSHSAKRLWLLLLLLLFCQCQPQSCSSYQPRMNIRPEDVFELTPQEKQTRLAEQDLAQLTQWQAADPQFAGALGTPLGYRRVITTQIMPGVVFKQFERGSKTPADPRYTIRALMIHPKAFKQLQVLFSDRMDHPLYSRTVMHRPGLMAMMSWCFFGRIPAGDMIGLRCEDQGRYCRPGIYYLSEKRTAKDINQRYTLAINHPGQIRIFRGGLGPNSRRWYRLAMGGGVLLFDRDKALPLYAAVGHAQYARLFTHPYYNHADIVRKGQAGYPDRAAPRSAAGMLSGGSMVFVNVGEGQYRFKGGITPPQLAKVLKEMGLVKALLYDGGGAPQMLVKGAQGRILVRTSPENTHTSNYEYNYAYLTLQRPSL